MILIGNSGTGKTHLGIALSVEACKKDYRVYFITACHLVNHLVEAQEEKAEGKVTEAYREGKSAYP